MRGENSEPDLRIACLRCAVIEVSDRNRSLPTQQGFHLGILLPHPKALLPVCPGGGAQEFAFKEHSTLLRCSRQQSNCAPELVFSFGASRYNEETMPVTSKKDNKFGDLSQSYGQFAARSLETRHYHICQEAPRMVKVSSLLRSPKTGKGPILLVLFSSSLELLLASDLSVVFSTLFIFPLYSLFLFFFASVGRMLVLCICAATRGIYT